MRPTAGRLGRVFALVDVAQKEEEAEEEAGSCILPQCVCVSDATAPSRMGAERAAVGAPFHQAPKTQAAKLTPRPRLALKAPAEQAQAETAAKTEAEAPPEINERIF